MQKCFGRSRNTRPRDTDVTLSAQAATEFNSAGAAHTLHRELGGDLPVSCNHDLAGLLRLDHSMECDIHGQPTCIVQASPCLLCCAP